MRGRECTNSQFPFGVTATDCDLKAQTDQNRTRRGSTPQKKRWLPSQRRCSVKPRTSFTLLKQPEAKTCVTCDQLLGPAEAAGRFARTLRANTHLLPRSLSSCCSHRAMPPTVACQSLPPAVPTAGEAQAKKNTCKMFTNLPLSGQGATENKVFLHRLRSIKQTAVKIYF